MPLLKTDNGTKPVLLNFIGSLGQGGAERQLLDLMTALENLEYHPIILTTSSENFFDSSIPSPKPLIFAVDLKQPLSIIRVIKKIFSLFRDNREIYLIGWMYYGSMAAFFFHCLMCWRKTNLIFMIRHSLDGVHEERLRVRLSLFLVRLVVFAPSKIFFNSKISLKQHVNFGFAKRKCFYLPNGIRDSFFANSCKASANKKIECQRKFRSGTKNIIKIVHVARFHPMKNHKNLFAAFSIVRKKFVDVELYCVGRGIDPNNGELVGFIDASIKSSVKLCGSIQISPEFLMQFDIGTMCSSFGEGFPNVLLEYRASGLLCVATPTGDSSMVVGSGDIMANSGNIEDLVEALELSLERAREIKSLDPESVRLIYERRIKSVEQYRYSLLSHQYAYAFDS